MVEFVIVVTTVLVLSATLIVKLVPAVITNNKGVEDSIHNKESRDYFSSVPNIPYVRLINVYHGYTGVRKTVKQQMRQLLKQKHASYDYLAPIFKRIISLPQNELDTFGGPYYLDDALYIYIYPLIKHNEESLYKLAQHIVTEYPYTYNAKKDTEERVRYSHSLFTEDMVEQIKSKLNDNKIIEPGLFGHPEHTIYIVPFIVVIDNMSEFNAIIRDLQSLGLLNRYYSGTNVDIHIPDTEYIKTKMDAAKADKWDWS